MVSGRKRYLNQDKSTIHREKEINITGFKFSASKLKDSP